MRLSLRKNMITLITWDADKGVRQLSLAMMYHGMMLCCIIAALEEYPLEVVLRSCK